MSDVINAFHRGLSVFTAYSVRQFKTTIQAALGN